MFMYIYKHFVIKKKLESTKALLFIANIYLNKAFDYKVIKLHIG